MFSFPADTISAQTITTPQLSSSSPAAITADEKALIDDILRELDQARKLTNDKDIQGQIGVIKEWVRKVLTLADRGDTQAALEIKYTIAKRLEWLINQLPTVTPGTTTAVAATATPNPLYDELVRIHAKIDKLIELEEREIPTEKPPPPPEIQRPPEMEKLIVYSAKFLCGPAFGGEGVQPGSYSTAINVHNPHNDTIYLFKKAVIAQREDEPRGRISNFRRVALGPDEAIEIDCIDIVRLFGAQQETRVTAPTQQTQTLLQTTNVTPISSLVSFIKGFVVIYATAPLDVVGVYTASTPVGFSLDVEYISSSTVGVRPILIPEEPEEEAECPTGCYCMTEAAAKERGYTDRCQAEPCGRDQYQNLTYCFKKPTEEATCPQGCECLALAAVPAGQKGYVLCQGKEIPCGPKPSYCYQKAECPQGCQCVSEVKAKELGLTICQNQYIFCGFDEQKVSKYCYQKPSEQAECPSPCVCLTRDDAYSRGYTSLCQEQPCGYVAGATGAVQTAKYCWKPTEQIQCPQGCYCLTKEEAGKRGYTALCQEKSCGTDTSGVLMYCWKPAEQVQCPQGCACVTEAEANKYGYTWCQNQKIPCGKDTTGALLYCFQKPVEQACPQGCYCLTRDDAYSRGYTSLCQEQPCGYVAGATGAVQTAKYCWKPMEQVQCPQGCYCLTRDDASKRGYTTLCQDAPCGYDQYKNPLYCFKPAPTTTQCPQGCVCMVRAEAEKQGYTVLCQDQPCGYDNYKNPMYCFKKPSTIPLIPRTLK